MVKVTRHITDKYKTTRLPPDSVYSSRLRQTFFNKFTKKGKKALARCHRQRALQHFRITYTRTRRFTVLINRFARLHLQFLLVSRRKGSKRISIPVPVRRNKRETRALQTLRAAVTGRRERQLWDRMSQEFISLTQPGVSSKTLNDVSTHNAKAYHERP